MKDDLLLHFCFSSLLWFGLKRFKHSFPRSSCFWIPTYLLFENSYLSCYGTSTRQRNNITSIEFIEFSYLIIPGFPSWQKQSWHCGGFLYFRISSFFFVLPYSLSISRKFILSSNRSSHIVTILATLLLPFVVTETHPFPLRLYPISCEFWCYRFW